MTAVIRGSRAVQCIIPLWICAAAPLLADVTIRYQAGIQVAASMPPQAKEQMEKALQASAGNYAMYMKNGKAMSKTGWWTAIIDFAKEQMTLIDTDHQTFATSRAADLPDKMAALMPKVPEEAQKMMAAMKTRFDTRMTGRMEKIQGIQAEEREMTLTIEMPMPQGAPQPAMTLRMVMQFWTAKPEEALTNQAVRELMGVNLWANSFMNPAATIQKMTTQMPGMGDALKSMTEELGKNKAVMLRTRTAMYIPMPGAAGDPNAPTFEMTQEAVEVSSAPVEERLFQVPADYKAIPAEELLKGIMQRQMAAGAPAK